MVLGNTIQERIIYAEKVAHVTFYLVEEGLFNHEYTVYSESEGRGLERYTQGFRPMSYNQAMRELREAAQHLENVIEKKSNGIPSAKQLHFLFRQRIPISLDLTWGEASALIEECINQIEYERQVKEQILF